MRGFSRPTGMRNCRHLIDFGSVVRLGPVLKAYFNQRPAMRDEVLERCVQKKDVEKLMPHPGSSRSCMARPDRSTHLARGSANTAADGPKMRS